MGVQRRLLQIMEGTYLNEGWFSKKPKQKEDKEITLDEAYKEYAEFRNKLLGIINGYKYKKLITIASDLKRIKSKQDLKDEVEMHNHQPHLSAYSAQRHEFKIHDRQEGHKQIYGDGDHDDSWEYWNVFFKMIQELNKEFTYWEIDDQTYKRKYEGWISLKLGYKIKLED